MAGDTTTIINNYTYDGKVYLTAPHALILVDQSISAEDGTALDDILSAWATANVLTLVVPGD